MPPRTKAVMDTFERSKKVRGIVTTHALAPAAANRLRAALNTYLELLSITVDAAGLEGEWGFDNNTGALVRKVS
jgi:hypothetical protein